VTLPGHPSVSIPLGLDHAGMPFGIQVIGPRGGDAYALAVAAQLEAALAGDAHGRRGRSRTSPS
jgi:Asp-tRNA(Asn)/Glu-tRNA(Gln) amidotransferase A subunit family amidase